jgi:hypothetical protein
MQYKPRTDKKKESVQLSHPESELQSQLDPPALQPDDSEAPKPARPEEPRAISVHNKAMAASAPGSEYWLP